MAEQEIVKNYKTYTPAYPSNGSPQWKDNAAGGTPITAGKLNLIETQLQDVYNAVSQINTDITDIDTDDKTDLTLVVQNYKQQVSDAIDKKVEFSESDPDDQTYVEDNCIDTEEYVLVCGNAPQEK